VRRSIQQQIDDLVKQGKRPSIFLPPGLEIRMPKGRRGRPRIRRLDAPFAHYADPRAHRYRATCYACHQRLRVHQRGYCSQGCAAAGVNNAIMALHAAGVTREELLSYYPEESRRATR
jgi:hypothetical protein